MSMCVLKQNHTSSAVSEILWYRQIDILKNIYQMKAGSNGSRRQGSNGGGAGSRRGSESPRGGGNNSQYQEQINKGKIISLQQSYMKGLAVVR